MAKTDNLTDFLTGVANAIRTKKGTTAKINPQNFETEIGSITTSKPEQEKAVVPTNAQNIVLPDSGKTLSQVIVMAAPLPTSNNSEYKYINGCLIATKTKTLLLGCGGSLIPTNNSVTSIGPQAFQSCDITNMTIPDSVTSISNQAFSNCSRLRGVTIGNSVASIGNYAFSGCIELTSVTIPDSVISIGINAFFGCHELTSIIVLNTTPPQLGSNVFPSNVTTITVPVGCGEAYKTAEGWSAYADKIVEATA